MRDLVRVLARRRRFLLGALAVAVLAGVATLFLVEPRYRYTTAIEIGLVASDGGRSIPIEDPRSVQARLAASYIPDAIGSWLEQHPDEEGPEGVSARVPDNASLVVLDGIGTAAAGPVQLELQRALAERVVADHAPQLDARREALETSRHRLELDGEALKDAEKQIEGQIEAITATRKLLARQVADLRGVVKEAGATRSGVESSLSSEASVMALLVIDSTLLQSRDRLTGMEERLEIQLERQRAELVKTLADNRRAQAQLPDQLAQADAELAALRPTRTLSVALRSLAPVSTPSWRIAGMVAGALMLVALAAVGVVELVVGTTSDPGR